MHDKRKTWARVGSSLLAASLLVVAVMKAQGCQRPMEVDEPAAQSPEPVASPTPQPTTAEQATVRASPPSGPDAGGGDAGEAVKIPPALIEEREVFPATKAGPVFRPTPNPPQQQAPK